MILLFCFVFSLTIADVSNTIEFSEKKEICAEIGTKNKFL